MDIDSVIVNPEILPIPKEVKKWKAPDYTVVWLTMSVGVLTWEYPWFGIFLGLPWYLSIALEFLGNAITLIPMVIQSHAGAKYGIAEPQVTRSRWGIWGAQIPSIIRAIIGTGWWGINVFIITEIVVGLYLKITGKLYSVIAPLLSSGEANSFTISLAVPNLFWVVFAIVIILELLILYYSPILRGQEPLRKMSWIVAPIVMLSLVGIFISEVHNYGLTFSLPSKFTASPQLALAFLAGNMASWLTMAISMPDLTRFAANQRAQIFGQLILPFAYALFGVFGVIGSSIVYSSTHLLIIDPVLLTLLTNPTPLAILLLLPLLMETFALNTLANLLPPGYDISNIFPKKISWFKGVLIATVIGLIIGAWSFLGSAYGFMVNWLLTYGIALGSIVGINMADYIVIRKFELDVTSLFTVNGKYRYKKGFNPAAFLAFIISSGIVYLPNIGVSNSLLMFMNSLGPLITLPMGFALYLIFMKVFKYS
ncbi:cytosine permease [Sulfolobaceae archaeon RB850M]